MPDTTAGSLQARRLIEQLRLVLGSASASAIPMVLVALVLIWTLSDQANALELKIWFVCVTSVKLFWVWDARHTLELGKPLEQPRRLVWRLIVTNAAYGAAWGALPRGGAQHDDGGRHCFGHCSHGGDRRRLVVVIGAGFSCLRRAATV